MADETKYTEHIVHGSVPPDEWEKFLKTHFKPGKPAAASPKQEISPGNLICGWLGCPSTNNGLPLHDCLVSVDRYGQVGIRCRYEVVARQ